MSQNLNVCHAHKMSGLKVDANISFMFKEWPNFIDRYKAASEAGYFMLFCESI